MFLKSRALKMVNSGECTFSAIKASKPRSKNISLIIKYPFYFFLKKDLPNINTNYLNFPA